MNPEMMKMAMDSMSRLTPAQMAEMQRQMASMPPGFLEKQMQAMQGMSPDVLQQQMAAADRMDPAAMDQQLKGAAAMARQQEEYQVRASNQLKEEGNRLFSAQKTTEAIEKYQRAKSNLSGHTSQSATDIASKCMLNLASCYLRLNDYRACITECSEVLKTDPNNMKALYRRGQAHLALHSQAAAVADLRKALARAPEAEQPLIEEKLREAEDGLVTAEEVAEGVADTESEAQADARSNAEASTSGGLTATLPSAPAFPMDPSQMQQARASGGAGLPDGIEMSPEAMQSAMQTMAGLDPKDLEGMVSKMQASAGGASAGGTNAGTSPLMGPDTDQFKQAAATLQANPELMSHAMKMFGQMDSEQLAAMTATMSRSGQGGQPSAAAMSKMLADPQSAKMMKDIMYNLTPEQLASMSEAAGQHLTPDQAEEMSKKIRNLSDKQVELLLKGASWLSRGATLAQQVKAKIMRNKLLMLGFLLLLVAVTLRYFKVLV
ncbi:hypothetical protein COCSUDRAFT_48306 [Coccomyxa subellipsoidea C-169]|uniref:Uncharacterized protein n=1 Tax=Coccomyxa subellipsoidea (strain C-169) TaxID=574566 RepID=I0YS10_COCSC|nr:hypothetical protein COCSUDRAFT_48306 [Coccomyxa subellipsoidea C-169]EIE21179.1 hypothetical protein COCSUDRAFT_48306 [Coccomyxa subellipsoidea C-169]|eukprot:XP_005645723.1 hypothetical protein COCSUDRAFT_48306 [Coccomyxa subellipsoidea C-169]